MIIPIMNLTLLLIIAIMRDVNDDGDDDVHAADSDEAHEDYNDDGTMIIMVSMETSRAIPWSGHFNLWEPEIVFLTQRFQIPGDPMDAHRWTPLNLL